MKYAIALAAAVLAGCQPAAAPVSFPASVTGDVAWIVAAHRERGFQSLVLDGAGPLHVTWVRAAAQADSGSGMPAARVMLEVSRDAGLVEIDAGIVPGEIEPSGTTLCGRLGYRESNGALLEPAHVNGLVSELTVGNMSGADDLLLVLGAGVLHVLRGQVTDGMCASQIQQGPLTVCRGQEYARVAEVRVGPVSSFVESILVAAQGDDAGVRSPLDCAAPTVMGTLTPPAAR
jgi:hypothetical protein